MTFSGPWDFAFDQPLGKQCFRPEPFRCWYPRVTGIRQSVRLEGVGEIYPTNIRLTASFHGDIAAVQEVSLLIDRHGKGRINRQKQGRFFLPFVIADDEREVFAVNVILSCSPLYFGNVTTNVLRQDNFLGAGMDSVHGTRPQNLLQTSMPKAARSAQRQSIEKHLRQAPNRQERSLPNRRIKKRRGFPRRIA